MYSLGDVVGGVEDGIGPSSSQITFGVGWTSMQHALLPHLISIVNSLLINFLLSMVWMESHLIEKRPWKVSSHPSSSAREENAALTCSLIVLSLRNVATFVLFQFPLGFLCPVFSSMCLCIGQC